MDLLTVNETADELRISVVGLWRLRRRNELPEVKIGGRVFFDRSDLEAYVAANKTLRREAQEVAA